MEEMPRKRKPFTHRETNRHGDVVWYFRRGKGKRFRLYGDYESPEFNRCYEAALAGHKPPTEEAARNTFRWLVQRYLDSAVFAGLAPETQAMRRRILNNAAKTAGNLKLHQVTREKLVEGMDRKAATPFAAINFVKVMAQLYKYAIGAKLATENPTIGIERPSPATDGHHTWTVEEVCRFQEHHALGTRPRLAMDLLLYTGLRRADVVCLGRQHVRNGVISYRTQKTRADVILPMLPPLAASIRAAANVTGDLTFLATEHKRPWVKESFGNWFAEQCIAAGVPGRAHGLRKAGATLAAENGASDKELAALYGWANPRMAAKYTEKASKAILAKAAAQKMIAGHDVNGLFPHFKSGEGDEPETTAKSTAPK